MFLRREILAVEKEGVEVGRWRIRRSIEPLVDAFDVEEATRIHGLLDAGWWEMVHGILRASRTRPGGFLHALRHAVRSGFSLERSILWHLAYLARACLLVGWAARERLRRVHAHFGTQSTTVAMLCHELGGPAYSFTGHGLEEFDDAPRLGLREKIDRATAGAASERPVPASN